MHSYVHNVSPTRCTHVRPVHAHANTVPIYNYYRPMLKAAKRKYEHKTFLCTYFPSLEYLAFVLS